MLNTWFNHIVDNLDEMPDPKEDIERISTLHSWYKHLGEFTKAYPLLIQGEEPRYDFSPSLTDENKKNFHWTVIMDYALDGYGIKIDDSDNYYKIPDSLKDLMKCFPIYLDRDFGHNSTDKGQFLLLECEMLCREFWNELTNLKKVVDKAKKESEEKEESDTITI